MHACCSVPPINLEALKAAESSANMVGNTIQGRHSNLNISKVFYYITLLFLFVGILFLKHQMEVSLLCRPQVFVWGPKVAASTLHETCDDGLAEHKQCHNAFSARSRDV